MSVDSWVGRRTGISIGETVLAKAWPGAIPNVCHDVGLWERSVLLPIASLGFSGLLKVQSTQTAFL